MALTVGDIGQAPEPKTLTIAEVRDAVSALTDSEYLRLYVYAKLLVGYSDPEDVVHEAIKRALEGQRRCPENMRFLPFLMGAIRSVVSAKFKERRTTISIETSDDGEAMQIISDEPDARAVLEASETFFQIMSLFSDDAVASKMIRGIVQGRTGEELRASVGLDETAFATKRTLIRRRLQARFPEGIPQ